MSHDISVVRGALRYLDSSLQTSDSSEAQEEEKKGGGRRDRGGGGEESLLAVDINEHLKTCEKVFTVLHQDKGNPAAGQRRIFRSRIQKMRL